MFPKPTGAERAIQFRRRQRGSALVIGIFVLTAMFLLAAALINMASDRDSALNQEVWGTRALAAANSGADAAMARLFPLDGAEPGCTAVGSDWTPPDVLGFHACQVFLSCQAITGSGMTQYLLQSHAVCASGDIRVSRQVEVTARGY
ncbi:MSHA biogenesis protein MshP [Shewanella cyperi]|uniref:MSHA biogenesis protein MshP n=1 Tax=Shewanella cyperi TaxID=2814292 RepID=A0A974XJQ1_9GAMM|nr:MSHA biogenesis protein MshP [Shewanella cyperi]QSX29677.1 MSHA biogenesis protein MshP [Shewanella cyperi]